MKKYTLSFIISFLFIIIIHTYFNAARISSGDGGIANTSSLMSPGRSSKFECSDRTIDNVTYNDCHLKLMPLYNQLRYNGVDYSKNTPPDEPYDSSRCGEAFCGPTTIAITIDALLKYDAEIPPFSDLDRNYPKLFSSFHANPNISFFGEKLFTGCRYFEVGTDNRLREGGTNITEMKSFMSSYIDQNFFDYTYYYRFGLNNLIDSEFIKNDFEKNKFLFVWRGNYEINCIFPKSTASSSMEALADPDDLSLFCERSIKRVGGHYYPIQGILQNKSDLKNIIVRFNDPYPDSNTSLYGVTRVREINGLLKVISNYLGIKSIVTQLFLTGHVNKIEGHPLGYGHSVNFSTRYASFISKVGENPIKIEVSRTRDHDIMKISFQMIDGLFGIQPK